MKRNRNLDDPAANFKLTKKAEGSLDKEDLSDVVKINTHAQKPKTFTLRLPDNEQQELQEMVAEVNKYSQYKKISANDVIRALIHSGKRMDPERIVKAIKEL